MTEGLIKVYVYPDNSNHEEPVQYMSDDYRVAYTFFCSWCGCVMHVDYDTLDLICDCGGNFNAF